MRIDPILPCSTDQCALASSLLAHEIEKMTPAHLNLAMALLIGKVARASPDGDVETLEGDRWASFSPMTNAEHFLEVLSRAEIVFGSHPIQEGEMDNNGETPVVGYWYSCHSFFSGLESEGEDLRTVVGQTCAKRLAHDIEYSSQWKLAAESQIRPHRRP